mmetsp:Transcript_11740/g.27947  ORF Transcript_11740/g.27947 Transcript_11740/m.27947 type:complete len:377 (-) Transcript_11740:45-1175(-)
MLALQQLLQLLGCLLRLWSHLLAQSLDHSGGIEEDLGELGPARHLRIAQLRHTPVYALQSLLRRGRGGLLPLVPQRYVLQQVAVQRRPHIDNTRPNPSHTLGGLRRCVPSSRGRGAGLVQVGHGPRKQLLGSRELVIVGLGEPFAARAAVVVLTPRHGEPAQRCRCFLVRCFHLREGLGLSGLFQGVRHHRQRLLAYSGEHLVELLLHSGLTQNSEERNEPQPERRHRCPLHNRPPPLPGRPGSAPSGQEDADPECYSCYRPAVAPGRIFLLEVREEHGPHEEDHQARDVVQPLVGHHEPSDSPNSGPRDAKHDLLPQPVDTVELTEHGDGDVAPHRVAAPEALRPHVGGEIEIQRGSRCNGGGLFEGLHISSHIT